MRKVVRYLAYFHEQGTHLFFTVMFKPMGNGELAERRRWLSFHGKFYYCFFWPLFTWVHILIFNDLVAMTCYANIRVHFRCKTIPATVFWDYTHLKTIIITFVAHKHYPLLQSSDGCAAQERMKMPYWWRQQARMVDYWINLFFAQYHCLEEFVNPMQTFFSWLCHQMAVQN